MNLEIGLERDVPDGINADWWEVKIA